jgi:hypothetical protein
MTLSTSQRAGILLTLALVMMGTRINHFSAIPDASWALFFLGGFYLRGWSRWAFPALMVLAVAVDWYVITASGINFWDHYCVSVAYWFLVPSYLALWFGGLFLRSQYNGLTARSLGWLVASFVASVSLCYLLSNGSFYWLSDSVKNASVAGWTKNLADWYLPYLYTASIYVAGASIVHALVALLAGPERAAAAQRAAR